MKKLTFVLVLVLIMAFGLASVAYAITNGQPDGDNHPYVGLIVFDVGDGPAYLDSGLHAALLLRHAGRGRSAGTHPRSANEASFPRWADRISIPG